ncbi:putative exonuclease [Bacillus phage CP-51]|uniref:Putative exonuclease n=1 Tax=Bacillus phage CP-51 TaxID=1391188 RepID=A0A068EP89_9CAUD|nr:recombination exonuclease [Bacillus phage CP-51]AID50489.1 putative exonuclease [Bacillus phage CP-51]
MLYAVSADIHGHIYPEHNKPSDFTGSTRLDNIVLSLRYKKEYCLANGIKHMMIAGDLYHQRARVHTVVYNSLRDEVKSIGEAGIEVLIIPGNHDQIDNSDFPQHSLHSFKELDNVTVVDDFRIVKFGDANVVCVPYSKNAQMVKDFIQSVPADLENPILLGHLGVSGGFVGNGNFPMADAFTVEDLRPDLFKYVFLGHFHMYQLLGGYPHVMYVGSPIEHSHGDEGEDKGFVVADDSKRYHTQLIPIPNPKFLTLDADAIHDGAELQKHAEAGNYLRFELNAEDAGHLSSIAPSNLLYKVILKKEYKEELRVPVKIGMSFEDIITKYSEEYNPDALEVGLEILQKVQQAKGV